MIRRLTFGFPGRHKRGVHPGQVVPIMGQKLSYDVLHEEPVFGPAEFERRVEVTRAAMDFEGVDVLLLFDPQNIYFFTGYSSVNLWDFGCLVVPAEGSLRLLLWEFELPRFQVSAGHGEPVTYRAGDDPVAALVSLLGSATRSYGTDDWSPSVSPAIWERLTRVLDGWGKKDAQRIVWKARLRKSPAEISKLERAAELTDVGVAAAADAVVEAARDYEIAAAASAAMLTAGSGHFSIQPIVAIGPRAGVPHSECSGKPVLRGEAVFLELGASVDRYTAPVMRTVVLGDADQQLHDLADVAYRVMDYLLQAMHPGVACAEIARAANKIVVEANGNILFHKVHGYSVGIGFPPSWIENLSFWIDEHNPSGLEEGMVLHVPLSLRHRATRGIGLSSSIVIQEGGPRVLGQSHRS
jgi:Xaa-Pro dipeptidase